MQYSLGELRDSGLVEDIRNEENAELKRAKSSVVDKLDKMRESFDNWVATLKTQVESLVKLGTSETEMDRQYRALLDRQQVSRPTRFNSRIWAPTPHKSSF